jgi:hypothetical protein
VNCPREHAVVTAVLTGAWPHRCDASLLAHVDECDVCSEVAAIVPLLQDDGERARYETPVPAAGQVWWRAAVRARLESTETAARPMSWMHSIAGAVIVGLVLTVLTTAWPMVAPAITRGWMIALSFLPTPEATAMVANSVGSVVTMSLVAAAVLVLTPLAVYLVLSDD